MYNTYYTFTGNTYRNRDELNRYGIGACWNPAEKRWELVGSLMERTLVNLRRMGVKISTAKCEPDGWAATEVEKVQSPVAPSCERVCWNGRFEPDGWVG